jgi:hypothetical protein
MLFLYRPIKFMTYPFNMRDILKVKIHFHYFRNELCDKIKLMVAQAAFQIYDSANNVQQAGIDTQSTTVSTSIDNNQSGEKDSCDDSPSLKRKTLFAYCETSQAPPKKMRMNIMDEINEEIMLFLKDQHYATDLIFVKKNYFPHLHRLALKILCIPATSAPAERIFSQSGLLMRPHRSRLTKSMLSKLTFIKCNIDLLD